MKMDVGNEDGNFCGKCENVKCENEMKIEMEI